MLQYKNFKQIRYTQNPEIFEELFKKLSELPIIQIPQFGNFEVSYSIFAQNQQTEEIWQLHIRQETVKKRNYLIEIIKKHNIPIFEAINRVNEYEHVLFRARKNFRKLYTSSAGYFVRNFITTHSTLTLPKDVNMFFSLYRDEVEEVEVGMINAEIIKDTRYFLALSQSIQILPQTNNRPANNYVENLVGNPLRYSSLPLEGDRMANLEYTTTNVSPSSCDNQHKSTVVSDIYYSREDFFRLFENSNKRESMYNSLFEGIDTIIWQQKICNTKKIKQEVHAQYKIGIGMLTPAEERIWSQNPIDCDDKSVFKMRFRSQFGDCSVYLIAWEMQILSSLKVRSDLKAGKTTLRDELQTPSMRLQEAYAQNMQTQGKDMAYAL